MIGDVEEAYGAVLNHEGVPKLAGLLQVDAKALLFPVHLYCTPSCVPTLKMCRELSKVAGLPHRRGRQHEYLRVQRAEIFLSHHPDPSTSIGVIN